MCGEGDNPHGFPAPHNKGEAALLRFLQAGFSHICVAIPTMVSHAAAPKPKCDENPRAHLCLAQYCHRHWSGKHANERINQEVIMLGLPFLLQACFDSKIRYYT